MSTQRYISTSFWDDKWIRSLNPSDRYLYMYLLTNTLTTISGIYRITIDRIAYDTGYDERTLRPMLERFSEAKKAVLFEDEYMILPSWPKHQRWEKKDTIRAGIEADLEKIPLRVKEYSLYIGYQYPIPNVPVPTELSYPDPDLHSDTNTHTEAPDVSVGVLESIKHPSNLPKLIYDKWQAIPGVTKDCDYMYWIQREWREIARAIEGFHSDIVLASLDNYRIERNNPNTWMTAKVSSRQFFTGGLFETCRGATDAKKKAKRCPACTCEIYGPEHFDDPKDTRIGVCLNPECELYHKEVS